MAQVTVHKMFGAEKGDQNEKAKYFEIGTAFLRPDGKTIGLEFNATPGDFVACCQDPKRKGGGEG